MFRSSFFEENRRAKELAMRIDRDIDLLQPHDQVSYRVAAYYKKRVKNVPSAWMMNDVPTRAYAAWYGRRVNPDFRVAFIKRVTHWFMDAYDLYQFIRPQEQIAVLAESDRRNAQKFLGRDAAVVRSGIDVRAFPYAERKPPVAGRVSLLAAGIFMRHRRLEDAIAAVKILTDRGVHASLTIIGDQENDKKYAEEIKTLVRVKKIGDRVFFSGRVSEEELVRAYQRHDIFLFPNDPQTWGLAVFEAMACGTPVIVSRGAGAHEVLTDRENALLVQPQAPREIVAAVEALVRDPALYSMLSRRGRAFVEERLGWDKYADAMEALFRRAMMK
ncbi:MAG: glycosyltransferase family 4 protein [Patescibacteria group bacterium]